MFENKKRTAYILQLIENSLCESIDSALFKGAIRIKISRLIWDRSVDVLSPRFIWRSQFPGNHIRHFSTIWEQFAFNSLSVHILYCALHGDIHGTSGMKKEKKSIRPSPYIRIQNKAFSWPVWARPRFNGGIFLVLHSRLYHLDRKIINIFFLFRFASFFCCASFLFVRSIFIIFRSVCADRLPPLAIAAIRFDCDYCYSPLSAGALPLPHGNATDRGQPRQANQVTGENILRKWI